MLNPPYFESYSLIKCRYCAAWIGDCGRNRRTTATGMEFLSSGDGWRQLQAKREHASGSFEWYVLVMFKLEGGAEGIGVMIDAHWR